MDKNIQKIKPSGIFTNYIYKSIPLAFDESMSYYETLCGVLSLLKTQEEVVNNNADLLAELELYVQNYFKNLDVQEEINNKLDEMAISGQLEEIINESLLASVEDKVTVKENFIFGLSFTRNPIKNYFIYSLDGINFKTIEATNAPFYENSDNSIAYDYDKNKFYIAQGGTGENSSIVTSIYETEDFVNYIKHDISINDYNNKEIWASDITYDKENHNLILTFSAKNNRTITTVDNYEVPSFDIIVGRINTEDFSVITYSNALINNNIMTNRIDSSIIKYNSVYYMIVKNSVNLVEEIYISNDLINYALLTGNILDANDVNNYKYQIEGGQLFLFNNKIKLIADNFRDAQDLIIGDTEDFINYNLAVTNLHNFKHASLIEINNNNMKKIVTSIENYGFSTSNLLINRKNISYIPLNNYNGNIIATPNNIYQLYEDNVIEDIKNPFNLKDIYFQFATNINKTLTIKKINGESRNLIITNNTYNNERIFKISMNGFKENVIDTLVLRNDEYTYDNSKFQILKFEAIKSGNIVNLHYQIKLLQNITEWQSNVVKINNDKFYPYMEEVQINTLSNLNQRLYENGSIFGNFNGDVDHIHEGYVTYITK